MNLELRFWSKVSIPNLSSCWKWQASKNLKYGQFRLKDKKELNDAT